MNVLLSVLLVLSVITDCYCETKDDGVTVLTVASNLTEGYQRYLRSANVFKVGVKTLGFGDKWRGGDMNFPGGGQKILLLKKELKSLMKEAGAEEKIALFSDSYDVIFLGELSEIVKRFKSFSNTRVLFSAEPFCWPDVTLAEKYPEVEEGLNRFLNSGGFMGYLPELYEMVKHTPVKNEDDDQLYYTNIYLDKELRERLKISLDHKSLIFQNLNGANVSLHTNDSEHYPYLTNQFDNRPLVLHGNGPSKLTLNGLSNYLAHAWSVTQGCQICKKAQSVLNEQQLPTIMMALFIEYPTPFVEEYFHKISTLNYPKDKIHLLVRNAVEHHDRHVEHFVTHFSKQYASFKQIKHSDDIDEGTSRNLALELTLSKKCDYFFLVDSIAHMDNKDTLRELLKAGFPVVAPLLTRPGKAWSNFWGSLTPEGYYARSDDYMEISQLEKRGVWNVPFINACYLVKSSVLEKYNRKQLTYKSEVDPDMSFCTSLRELGVFMYVLNIQDYGHLIDPETFDITLTNPDVYQIFENKWDWEQRYLNPEYAENFNPNIKPKQPCPDVYWFPVVTMRFCTDYIEIMEAFGKWSDGSNNDKRLEGGYEAVPTRDIHTNQIGYERHWLYILQEYVRPLQELVFTGYYHDPPRSLMNFVVRYRPGEQPSLRPHHDSSTYTINLALNTAGDDYEGGGCHFIRYNCSVKDTRPGWLLMHPGRLTHYHEGLLVTKGTRYIMISFVDP